jgi:hypothetical protein
MDIKSLYKKFLQQKSISVPKNKIKSKQAIPVSKLGLWDKNKNKVIVPSNRITMKGPKGEQDFFKKPVLATGLQSGKKVMMQPGREYYFPEDEAVFETKMQDGGKIDLTNDIAALNPNNKKSSNFQALELALAPVTFLPPPTGTIAGLASAGINLAQGDLPGLGLDVAGVASGGVSKVFKAAMQEAKLAGAGRVAKNMGDKAKFFNAASNPNIYKSMGFARDYYSNEQDNSNARTNYKDNTRVASPIKPVKSKMQYGGLFPVGPYDEMIAPKQGNYLLPDINRPYYIDDEGGRRSEYRTGINIDGKETLLPTVVGGRQLTDEQAEDQYMRTGLNMGKFNNVEDADYASRLRTARYNMFADPIRFSADQFQGGGTVKTSMIEEPKKDSLPILLDSLLSQYQKTKAEFDVDSDNPKMQFGAISYNLDEPEPIRPPDQKPLKEGAGKLNTWLYNQAVADRKKQQSLFDAEQATDKELAYTKRANYMDLLTNEFYGTDRPFDDLTEEEQNNLLDIVQNRKSNLNNLSLKAADLTKKGIKAGYDPNRNIMVVPKVPVKRGVHSHELSHVGDQSPFATRENPGVGPYFTEQINQSMYGKDSSDFLNQPSTLKKDKTVGQNIETGFNEAEYLRDPSEVKARLKALRDASVEQGYQLLKPDYDINNYKSGFTEDETNQYNQLKSSGLSDEKINELMYLFAKQNTPQPVIAQSGAELSTEQNPVRMNPIDIAAKRRNPNYRTYQDNTNINNQIVPSEFRDRRYVQPTLSEYVEPSIGDRILRNLASPMTALSNNRTGSRNPYDYALDMVNPFSWIESGEKAVGSLAEGQYTDAALNALGALPAIGFADDAARFASKAGKYATTKTPLKNAYKINPKALKEAQETMLVRARPVGQNPYVNMAEQIRAKEAAGEPLKWYQKNLLNPQTNPQIAAREKYFGQWFADNPSDLDFYINPETRNFADDAQIEILKARMPKSEAAKYNVKNFEDAKSLSNLHDTEYILPKDMVQTLERFPVEDLGKLQDEYRQINTPHWLRGYKPIEVSKFTAAPTVNNFSRFDELNPQMIDDIYQRVVYNPGYADDVQEAVDNWQEFKFSSSQLNNAYTLPLKEELPLTRRLKTPLNIDESGYVVNTGEPIAFSAGLGNDLLGQHRVFLMAPKGTNVAPISRAASSTTMQGEREILFPPSTKFKKLDSRINPQTGLEDYIIGLGMQMGGMSIPGVNGTVVASSPSLYSKAKKRKK